MPAYDLDGKVAAVTGAASGIGRAIALRLAREGASVTVSDINEAGAAAVAEEIAAGSGGRRGRAMSVRTDVSIKDDAENLVRATVAEFGGLDILVNNAGVLAVGPILDTDEATWDRVMNVNAKGVLFCSQAAARQMIEQGRGGRIIINASGAGKIAPGKNMPLGIYAASKHAVVGLTKQLGLELSSHQILVNCVCAGIVDTPMWDEIDREVARLQNTVPGSVMSDAVAGVPLERVEQPEDVANMIAFLASSDAGYITAQTFNVCGGMLPY